MLRATLAALVVVSALAILASGGSPGAPAAATAGTHGKLAPGQRCPITEPTTSGDFPPALHTRVSDAPTSTWYGHGRLWVMLPDFAGAITVQNGSIYEKVPWYVKGPGVFRITGRRLDGTGTLHALVATTRPLPSGQIVFSSVIMPRLGCWAVRGTIGTQSIEWVFQPQLAVHG